MTPGLADPQPPSKRAKLNDTISSKYSKHMFTMANAPSIEKFFPGADSKKVFSDGIGLWTGCARMFCYSDESFDVEIDIDPRSDINEVADTARNTFPDLDVSYCAKFCILLSKGSGSRWRLDDLFNTLFMGSQT